MLSINILAVVGTLIVLFVRVSEERKKNPAVLHSPWPLPARFLLLPADVKAALVALAIVRLGCGGLLAYFPATRGRIVSPVLFLWEVLPAILVFTGARWPIWLTIVGNSLTVGLGLLAMPSFGHLHGGELVAYAAVPASLELLAGIYSITAIRNVPKGYTAP